MSMPLGGSLQPLLYRKMWPFSCSPGSKPVVGGLKAVPTRKPPDVHAVARVLLLTCSAVNALGGWRLRATLDLKCSTCEAAWPEAETASGAGAGSDAHGLVFNDNYPWLSCSFARPSSGCGTGAPIIQHRPAHAYRAKLDRSAPRTIFAAFLKLLPVFSFSSSRMIAVALRKSVKIPAVGSRCRWPDRERGGAGGFPRWCSICCRWVCAAVRGRLLASLMSSLAGAFNASSTLSPWTF